MNAIHKNHNVLVIESLFHSMAGSNAGARPSAWVEGGQKWHHSALDVSSSDRVNQNDAASQSFKPEIRVLQSNLSKSPMFLTDASATGFLARILGSSA